MNTPPLNLQLEPEAHPHRRRGGLPAEDGNKEVTKMKTNEQLITMSYDELRTEASLAMDYWEKVRALRDFRKIMNEVEKVDDTLRPLLETIEEGEQ